jgi:tetratricopeptide (TPR) repeat protein
MTGRRLLPTALILVLVGSAGPAAAAPVGSAAPQTAGASAQPDAARAELQARVRRAGAELFGRNPRADVTIRELKAILAVDPSLAEAHMMLGVAYRSLDSPDMLGEAVAELRQALALDETLAPARLYLAFVYLDLGRVDRARDEMERALEKIPNQPQFLALLGEAERRLKNPARAVELLRKAVPADPTFAQSRYYLGLALLDLGKHAEGIAELEAVAKMKPGVAEPYLTLGTAYLDAGQIDAGLEILSQGTHVDGGRPDLRIQLARAYRLKRRFAEAGAQLDIAGPRVKTTVASSFAHQPEIEFDYYVERGLLAAGRGQYSAAVAALKQALELEPDHGPTHRELSIVYSRLGNTKLAAQHAARAKALGSPK